MALTQTNLFSVFENVREGDYILRVYAIMEKKCKKFPLSIIHPFFLFKGLRLECRIECRFGDFRQPNMELCRVSKSSSRCLARALSARRLS